MATKKATKKATSTKAANTKATKSPKAATKKTAPAKQTKGDQRTGDAPRSQLDLEETQKLETARAKKAKAKPDGEKKLSGLDAAVKVLGETGQPMKCQDVVDQMLSKGYWSTNGATPSATIYAAIIREIRDKGDQSRFRKVDRGSFALREDQPKSSEQKTPRKKSPKKPADGDPGPKSVSELFKI